MRSHLSVENGIDPTTRQFGEQTPPTQNGAEPSRMHSSPHPPQFCGSVFRFTQAPKHPISPAGHGTQIPLTQLPEGHCVSHDPQLFGSFFTSMHDPLQAV
jgi:hypothetical protein